jgi:hypothetical protein
MADADVAITAGTGTKIDTRTVGAGTDEHRQVVVLGDPTTAARVVTVTDLLALLVEDAPIATATLTNVTSSASSVTIDAANSARRGMIIHNDSTAILFLKYGATASATSYTVEMGPGAYWEMPKPIYTGIIDGIWSAADGFARVTELTA